MSSIQARQPLNDLLKGQRHGKKRRIRKALAASVCVFALGTAALHAQSTGTLARAQLVSTGGAGSCPVILINFNQELAIVGQSVTPGGQTLMVRLIESGIPIPRQGAIEQIQTQPSLSVPGLGTAFVTLDISSEQPVLNIRFTSAPPMLLVTQAGTRSVVVSMFERTGNCSTETEAQADTPSADGNVGDLPASDAGEAARLFSDARAAVTAAEYDRAVQILTKLLAMPANPYSADAQETLGIVRERNGQLAHAKAEYEIYLQTYPNGAGAERVKQRLAAIETAAAARPGGLRPAGAGQTDLAATTDGADVDPGEARITSIPRKNETFPPLLPQPSTGLRGAIARIGETVFRTNETPQEKAERRLRERAADPPRITVSLYYYLNQSSTLITELEDHTTESDTEIQQNSAVLSVNVSDSFYRGNQLYSYRFSGDYSEDFTDSSKSRLNLSRFYGEWSMGTNGPSIALGRQSWSDDASLGRYDGVRVRYTISDNVRLSGVFGLSVNRKSDPMFSGDDRVLGITGDLLTLGEKTELSGYFLKEFSGAFTDRLVAGVEASFSTESNSGRGLIEYDLSLESVSTARASWSHRFEDRSSFTVTAEYDHSPNLALNAALVGQSVTTLQELNGIYTLAEIRGLARDRSAETYALSASWQKPLSEKWQLSVDGSAYYTGASPASGFVPAVEAPGWSYNVSAQLVGTGVFVDDDVFSISARAADDVSSQLIMLDGYWRYNVSDKLRIKPRLKIAHRTFADGTGSENFAIPSITLNYDFNVNNSFEVELGTRLSNRETPGISEETNDTFLTLGFTREF